ncbi:MAG: hypothetical protein ACFB20_11130 [Opitutales bacterium]
MIVAFASPNASFGAHGFEQATASFDFTAHFLKGSQAETTGDGSLPKVVPDLPVPGADLPPPPTDPFSAAFGAAAQALTIDPTPEPDQAGAVGLSPAPVRNFQGLDDNNTSIPPDTMGAVGPNHIMVVSNTEVRILDRLGNQIGSDISLDNWWRAFGSTVDSRFLSADAFDPKILYDPIGERFFFTVCANDRSSTAAQLFAVSASSDPTGTWYALYLDADPTNIAWTDFPSIGFSKNWLVCHVALFPVNEFDTVTIDRLYVIPRAAAYNNDFSNVTVIDRTDLAITAPARTYDENLNTHYLLRSWSTSSGTLRLGQLTGPINNPTFSWVSFVSEIGVDWAFNTPTSREGMVPQLGTTQRVSANDARMRELVYRNGTLWAAHHIFLPTNNPSRVAIQWWQISTTGGTLQRGLIDDPTGVKDYIFPSLDVNQNNDVLIGYSRGGPDQFISANYALRLGTDPPDVMRQEVVFKEGEAPYFKTFSGTRNRWGDYSATQVDPLNDSDFWTIQQYAETPFAGSDRWGLWWALVSPAGSDLPMLSLFQSGTTSEVAGAVSVTITSDRTVTSDLPVRLQRTGTASAGDVVFSPSYTVGPPDFVTIPAGQNSVTVRLNGVEDDQLEGTETVVLTLQNNNSTYAFGTPSSITVNIDDSEADQWRFDFFSTAGADPSDPAVSAWDVDFEGDGLPTLFDRGLGLSPTAHDAAVAAFKPTLYNASATGPGNHPGIFFTRPTGGVAGIEYALLAKDSIDATSDRFTPVAFTQFITGDATSGREGIVLQMDAPLEPSEPTKFLQVQMILEETLGSLISPFFQWTSGGTVPWTQADTGFDDDSALQLGPLFQNDSSFVETVAEGPSLIDFAWMIERGGGNAELSLEIDGSPVITRQGNFGWTGESYFLVDPTPVPLRIAFTYDGTSPVGALAMVDAFEVIPFDALAALGQALNPTLTWNAGGDAWGLASPGFNSDSAGQLGPIFQNEEAFFETTVQGPITLDFAWRILSGGGNSRVALEVDGVEVFSRPGNFGWQQRSYNVESFGAVPVRFNFTYDGTSPNGATAQIDSFQTSPYFGILAEAVDTPTQLWETGGNAGWMLDTSLTFDGVDSARSGDIGNSQRSYMRTTLLETSRVTFRWRVASEANFDFIRVRVDGVLIDELSGFFNWRFVDLGILPAGTPIEFAYEKDFSVSTGLDAGFVDQVTITPVN